MKKTITTITAACALLTLAACGTGKANEAVANAPRPTVTITAPAKPAPTVTTTTEVETVPQSCLDALDAADNAITTAGDGFGILADAMQAASNFDADGITDANARLKALNTDELTPAMAAYKTARDTCKAAN